MSLVSFLLVRNITLCFVHLINVVELKHIFCLMKKMPTCNFVLYSNGFSFVQQDENVIECFAASNEVPADALQYNELNYVLLMRFRIIMERTGLGNPQDYMLARYLLAVGDNCYKVMYRPTSL